MRQFVEEASHRLFELRVDFVGDGHHIDEHQSQIDRVEVHAQRVKDTHLKDPGLFDEHGRGVALLAANSSMRERGHGNPGLAFNQMRRPEPFNQLLQQYAQMASSIVIADFEQR